MSGKIREGFATSIAVLLLAMLMVVSFTETVADAELVDSPGTVVMQIGPGSP